MVHEWALADALARYIVYRIGGEGKKNIKRVIIRLGVLQSIDKEILGFALKEILESMGYQVKEIDFEDEEPVLKCRKCGYEWKPDMNVFDETIREAIHFVPETIFSYYKCPRCGSRDFDIVKGRGVDVTLIEVE
ncbi:MAG: hydrogenase nickel incorporation protein HypA [Crenarchaeota archaeon]|nr:hydrogenase nickel incorporation protein HypA [Thermoproteota archaeon]